MQELTTRRLVLEPLVVAHAEAMFELLRDAALYRYLDDSPPASAQQLRDRYARLEARESPDGRQRWLNWVIRPRDDGAPIGYVQATVLPEHASWVAYVLGRAHWGCGYANEATGRVLEHLASAYGVERFLASVEAQNERSLRLLGRLGFRAATAQELEAHELTASERLLVATARRV